jgi:hypothetical protein
MWEDEWYPVYGIHASTPLYFNTRDIKEVEYEDYLTGMIYESIMSDGNVFLEKLYNENPNP